MRSAEALDDARESLLDCRLIPDIGADGKAAPSLAGDGVGDPRRSLRVFVDNGDIRPFRSVEQRDSPPEPCRSTRDHRDPSI